MYQLEVKSYLVAARFRPADGWRVTVDIDAMERARGGSHPEGKRDTALAAEQRLVELGVVVGCHPIFGRADIVAEHPTHGTFVVEVEGDSSRQREQAMYSALGQTLLVMREFGSHIKYAVAVPDRPEWTRQLHKVPAAAAERLNLHLLAVSTDGAREVLPERAAGVQIKQVGGSLGWGEFNEIK